MSVKIKFLTFACGAVLAFPFTAQAVENHSGFGEPFANIGHAGFEDPANFADGAALQAIEPAAGIDFEYVDSLIPPTQNGSFYSDFPDAAIDGDATADTPIDILGP